MIIRKELLFLDKRVIEKITFSGNADYWFRHIGNFELKIPFVLIILLYIAEVVIVEYTDEYDEKDSNEDESSFLSFFFKLNNALIDLILFLFINSILL